MTPRNIVVIGSSAGGISALQRICERLPKDLPASIFVAQHLAPTMRSVLPSLLDRVGPLPATTPVDGEAIRPGRIYVAAPDHHMLLRPGRILMRRGPQENRTRPAINALFRSAALAYGARVVGVVLTGLLDDGTQGLIAIKGAGGVCVVQDPEEAEWPAMPLNAIQRDHVDVRVRLAELPDLLARLTREEAGATTRLPDEYRTEDSIAAQELATAGPEIVTSGQASRLSCPDCGGVLNEIGGDNGSDMRFRCQVGHAFTPLGLAQAQNEELERALSVAVRTHRDRLRLFSQMRSSAQSRGMTHAEARWTIGMEEAERLIAVLEQAMATLRHRTEVADS